MRGTVKIASIIVGIILFFILIPIFGRVYQLFIPQNTGLFIVSQEFIDLFIGLPLSYIFSLTLLLTAFGGSKKYWWLGVLLIPAAAFEIYFDFEHIYFPILIGLVAWLAGAGISVILQKSRAAK